MTEPQKEPQSHKGTQGKKKGGKKSKHTHRGKNTNTNEQDNTTPTNDMFWGFQCLSWPTYVTVRGTKE
jgi:hypothetical protein